jgi:hypothetical protein
MIPASLTGSLEPSVRLQANAGVAAIVRFLSQISEPVENNGA